MSATSTGGLDVDLRDRQRGAGPPGRDAPRIGHRDDLNVCTEPAEDPLELTRRRLLRQSHVFEDPAVYAAGVEDAIAAVRELRLPSRAASSDPIRTVWVAPRDAGDRR